MRCGQRGRNAGIGVSAYASTPYNVAVGGTDFGDTAAGTNSAYWSSTNSATFASALLYIPEIPWNDSCASGLLAAHFGYSAVIRLGRLLRQRDGEERTACSGAAGSGGPSGCATGNPASTGVVGGTCKGYGSPPGRLVSRASATTECATSPMFLSSPPTASGAIITSIAGPTYATAALPARGSQHLGGRRTRLTPRRFWPESRPGESEERRRAGQSELRVLQAGGD